MVLPMKGARPAATDADRKRVAITLAFFTVAAICHWGVAELHWLRGRGLQDHPREDGILVSILIVFCPG